MRFSSSYEPGEFESDIYGAWEASGVFEPTISSLPSDNDGDAFFLASVHNGKVSANISCIQGVDLANLLITVMVGDPRMRDVFVTALSGYDTLQNSN